MAVAKKPAKTTAVVKWDEALAARMNKAKAAVAHVGGGGDWVSFKNGTITFKDNNIGKALECIIPTFILENAYYDGAYDPNNPASPVCFAFGQDEDEMAPHEKCEKPQAESCAACPFNEWDSGDGGRGKACKNMVRLAILPADAIEGDGDELASTKEAFAKVPVTSVKAWGSYVNTLASSGKPPLCFVTEISVEPDTKSQFKLSFKAKEEIPGELIGPMLEKAEAIDAVINFPYVPNEDKPAPAPRRGRQAAAPAQGRPSARRGKLVEAEEAPAKPAARGRTAAPAAPARGRAAPAAPAAKGRARKF